jgi:branched-chain amino acid transport system ATP-binding protein
MEPRSTSAAPDFDSLEIEDLRVAYEGAEVIHGVSLYASTSEIVAIVGENGAGKSTVLRAITGFGRSETGRVTGGSIRFGGQDVTRASARRTASLGLTLVPEREKVFARLTVEENLHVPPGKSTVHERLEEAASLFPRLGELRKKKAGYLSGGERQMLAIALALAARPRMLLVDELSLGLAPRMTEDLLETVRQLRTERILSFIVVEERLSLAQAVADRIYIMQDGFLDTNPR